MIEGLDHKTQRDTDVQAGDKCAAVVPRFVREQGVCHAQPKNISGPLLVAMFKVVRKNVLERMQHLWHRGRYHQGSLLDPLFIVHVP